LQFEAKVNVAVNYRNKTIFIFGVLWRVGRVLLKAAYLKLNSDHVFSEEALINKELETCLELTPSDAGLKDLQRVNSATVMDDGSIVLVV